MSALLRTKVESLRPKENKIFFANRDDKIVDVWKGLIQHGFISAPVLQKTGQKWYGFISIEDIMHYMVQHFGDLTISGESFDFFKAMDQDKQLQQKTVKDVMTYPLSRKNPFHPATQGYSLMFAFEMMAREKCLHRIPIVDEDRNLKNVLTQSHLVEWLNNNSKLLGSKRTKPISQIVPCGSGKVKTINEKQTAITAFQELVRNHISALAVVNDEGKLTGALSATDLKAITSDGSMFWRLWQQCHNFLNHIKKETNEKTRPRRLVMVKADSTLEEVIRQLSEHKIHRVFVVDQNHSPIGVCSLRDVLREIITPPDQTKEQTFPSQSNQTTTQ